MYHILKFGGTSMGSVQSLQTVINILVNKSNSNNRVVAAVSAMSKVTDLLLELAKEAKNKSINHESFSSIESKHLQTLTELAPGVDQTPLQELLNYLQDALTNSIFINEIPTQIYFDYIASFGERLSALLLSLAMQNGSLNIKFVDARDFLITDDNFGNAKVDYEKSEIKTQNFFEIHEADIYIVTGFIARTEQGQTTTLGRGGSDFTGGLLANFLDAQSVEIWTDVDGILSTDPRLVSEAKIIPNLSYREAFEVAYYGGKVLYPKTMEASLPKNVDIIIKNTFRPELPGSKVSSKASPGLKVVSRVKKAVVVEVVLAAITSEFGLLGKIFSWFGEHKISVDVVTTSGDSVSFSCDRLPPESLQNKIRKEIGEVNIWDDKEIVAVIGSEIAEDTKYNQICNIINSYKPIMLSLNTKQTNLTAIVNQGQSEELVKQIHKIITQN